MLRVEECEELLLTHELVAAGPIPTAYDPEGVYPYESYCETGRRPVIRKYRMLVLENDRLRVTICPDLGGRVHSLFLKEPGIETLCVTRVVRPVRILPRHFFIGGGIEVSFPISHTPSQIVPVRFDTARDDTRIYVSCGEREQRFGMHWTVEYSLGEEDAFLTQRTVFFNPGANPHPWMSWSNAGVPVRPDTEFHFPGGPVLSHGGEMRMIDWNAEGPRRQSDIARMTGFFWRDPDCCAFGAFTPSLRAGLYHVADPALTPGIKLWSDGVGRDERWVSQYTLAGEQCLEIQAGPLVDQSIKDQLQPGQQRHHVEFWIPSAEPRRIREIALPRPQLRDLEAVPRFDWVQSESVSYWLAAVAAHRSGDTAGLPAARGLESNDWAPSGMEELGPALEWAAAQTEGLEQDRWFFQQGAWLAGRGKPDAALEVLSRSRDDRARALRGRLEMRHRQDPRAAVACLRAVECEAVALHPQVVIEMDKALAALGPATLEERTRRLERVAALDDEWLVERRAAVLLAGGNAQGARDLLEKTRFQLVHQRYARTRLWREIERRLNLPSVEYPAWLGEDDLAEFGAYREYAED